jgi:hypothetical protein
METGNFYLSACVETEMMRRAGPLFNFTIFYFAGDVKS